MIFDRVSFLVILDYPLAEYLVGYQGRKDPFSVDTCVVKTVHVVLERAY